MNGQNSFTNKNTIARREFLKLSAAGAFVAGLGIVGTKLHTSKRLPHKNIPGALLGPSDKFGHLLRDGYKFQSTSQASTDVLIVGGGIAGLSAGWWLKKNGFDHFKIIELESDVGGNSRSGKNSISPYPWGAHYVPIASDDAVFVKEFFRDIGVITGIDSQGLDIYHDDYLCNDPHERLFFQGSWQDSLVPSQGLSQIDHQEMKNFLTLMDSYKVAKGRDQKKAFAIPLEYSSRDKVFLQLDLITMKEFLDQNSFRSASLHWYVNYCCRDDYGATYDKVSAWAGIHYFAGRYGKASNADSSTVVTWPEGNGWLVSKLREILSTHLLTNSMALTIDLTDNIQNTKVLFTKDDTVQSINSKQLIFAAPRFLWPYLAPNHVQSQVKLDYDPWMVANISVDSMPKGRGTPVAWDNVSYYSPSLGYVVATHQAPVMSSDKSVLTYYLPLSDREPRVAREWAIKRAHSEWVSDIVDDFENMHEGLSHFMSNIDVTIWGHAMIRPRPGFVWGSDRASMQLSIHDRVHFAHSDMSGISIFEEAQFHGVMAAKKVLQSLPKPTHKS